MGVAAFMNIYFINKYIGYRIEMGKLVKTIAASFVMAGATWWSFQQLWEVIPSNTVATFGAVFFGCAVYIAVMIVIGGIGEADMEQVPILGRHTIKILPRIGVFKEGPSEDSGSNLGEGRQ